MKRKKLLALESTRSYQKFKIIDKSEFSGMIFEFNGEALANGKFWASYKSINWVPKVGIDDSIKIKIMEYINHDYPDLFEFE